jgi:hypothetical protein
LVSPIRPAGVCDTIPFIASSTPTVNFYYKRNYKWDN